VTRVLGLGLGLTAGVTAVECLAWGRLALVPGATFGLLATAIQAAAVARLRPALTGSFPELLRRWSVGMGLRLLGVVLFVVAVVVDRDLFPPLPAAFGYLGVLIPLLFGEIRLAK
jgi:hypothetical protein